MRAKQGCSWAALFVVLGCLLTAVLAVSLFATGEAPLHDPRLTGIEPGPNYAFQPTTPITLSFDQPMEPTSVESAFLLSPAVPGTFHWNEDRTETTFVPSGTGYELGTRYTARLSAGAKAGTLPRMTNSAVEWWFSLPPLLEDKEPVGGGADMGAWPRLKVVFNYALNCEQTVSTFAITPAVAGALACYDRTITFRPTEPLAPDTRHTATLEHVHLEGDPSMRPGVVWRFRTAPRLRIVDVSPSGMDPLTDLWVPVAISFSRPVVEESVTSRFSLRAAGGAPLTGQQTWELNGARFVFVPDEPLYPATAYQITLLAGVYDELGFELEEPISVSVHTTLFVGIPSPSPEARNVRLDSAIRVPFTRGMDRASVEAGFSLTPTLEGAMSWEEDTLVFLPQGGLAPETAYQVALSAAVRDASGAPLAKSHLWAFVTEEFLADVDVPSGKPVLELRQPVAFSFALPMDRNSVRSALSIMPETQGEMTWTDDDRGVVFLPDPAWLPGTGYQVNLSGSARTKDGYQTLGEDRDWTFATGVAQVQFGKGPNLQVMDAAGDRTLQVWATGADVADLALYAITPTQFLDLYSSGFRGVGPEEERAVDFGASVPVAAWRDDMESLEAERHGMEGRPAQINLPGDVPPGLYVVTADPASDESGQLLIVLSHHALVLKRALAGTGSQAQAQVVAWDTKIGDGSPVVSSTVSLFERDGTLLAQTQTDGDGLAVLDVPGDPGPLLGLAELDGDWTVCGLSNEWTESGWWWWWSQPPAGSTYATYSYTDRPIYRPAQTVYFKDMIRADEDVSYTLPSPDLLVSVRLRDARDNIVSTQVLTTTQFGTVHGAFELADEPMLGIWNLETVVADQITRQPFKVEEYRKPEYSVTVSVPQSVYIHGEPISVTVDTGYYYGEPVAGADVILHAYPSYPDDYYGEQQTSFGYPLTSMEGRIDDQGRWAALVPTEDLFSRTSRARRIQLALEATVSDGSGQSVSSYETIAVLRTAQGLSLNMDRHGYRPEEEIPFSVWVLDRNGNPVDGIELATTVLGWDDRTTAHQGAVSDSTGEARFSLRLPEQGWYTLRVSGSDDNGREMSAEDYIWVYDPSGQAPWYQGQWGPDAPLTVSADRRTYAPGDVAQILVNTIKSGPALLTFERGQTRDAMAVDLISGTNLITFPVRSDYAPNIHVNVAQYGPVTDWWSEQSKPEAELHSASAEVYVPMPDRMLDVQLVPDQVAYGPGESAVFHIRVTDTAGQPVEAEVSLVVVDEAIYALAEDLSKDPFEVFYGPRPNLVRTYDSLRPTRWLWEEGPGLGGGDEEGSAPRRDFLDTAYWAPTVVTDERGEAIVTFDWPDNLTEWRALARAITADTRVGQATTSAVVSKEIVVRPSLPRFLVQGDVVTLTATIHNYTGQAVSATVDLDLEGPLVAWGAIEGDTQRQLVSVPVGGSTAVGFPVSAAEAGQALVAVQTTATYGGAKLAGRDAVKLPLSVYPLAIPEVTAHSGILEPARPTDTLTLTVPADAIDELSSLQIRVDSSVAPGLLDGLEYLVGYPYG